MTRLPPHETLSIGSALKFGLVAEGGADLYYCEEKLISHLHAR